MKLETIRDASQFWIHGSLEQKRRFQQLIFPEGLVFDGQEFGTAPTCIAFSYLQGISEGKSSLASRARVEPVSPPVKGKRFNCSSTGLSGLDGGPPI